MADLNYAEMLDHAEAFLGALAGHISAGGRALAEDVVALSVALEAARQETADARSDLAWARSQNEQGPARDHTMNQADACVKALAQSQAELAGLREERDRPWAVLDWLAANYPSALELCPYKARRG